MCFILQIYNLISTLHICSGLINSQLISRLFSLRLHFNWLFFRFWYFCFIILTECIACRNHDFRWWMSPIEKVRFCAKHFLSNLCFLDLGSILSYISIRSIWNLLDSLKFLNLNGFCFIFKDWFRYMCLNLNLINLIAN